MPFDARAVTRAPGIARIRVVAAPEYRRRKDPTRQSVDALDDRQLEAPRARLQPDDRLQRRIPT